MVERAGGNLPELHGRDRMYGVTVLPCIDNLNFTAESTLELDVLRIRSSTLRVRGSTLKPLHTVYLDLLRNPGMVAEYGFSH